MPEAAVTAGRQETPSNTSQASGFGPAADTLTFSELLPPPLLLHTHTRTHAVTHTLAHAHSGAHTRLRIVVFIYNRRCIQQRGHKHDANAHRTTV